MSGTPPDPSRRRFFREFAGQVVSSAAQVVGAVAEIRDQSAAEAQALLRGEAVPSRRLPGEKPAGVIARETTDNNNYANNFMSLGYVKKGLCKAGFGDGIEFQQVRQIGPQRQHIGRRLVERQAQYRRQDREPAVRAVARSPAARP